MPKDLENESTHFSQLKGQYIPKLTVPYLICGRGEVSIHVEGAVLIHLY